MQIQVSEDGSKDGQESAFCTPHARKWLAQSNLLPSDVDLVRRHGTLQYRDGARLYFVRRRDVLRHRLAEPRMLKLHSLVLVVASDSETVITAYRNGNGMRQIKRKPKRRRDPESKAA